MVSRGRSKGVTQNVPKINRSPKLKASLQHHMSRNGSPLVQRTPPAISKEMECKLMGPIHQALLGCLLCEMHCFGACTGGRTGESRKEKRGQR